MTGVILLAVPFRNCRLAHPSLETPCSVWWRVAPRRDPCRRARERLHIKSRRLTQTVQGYPSLTVWAELPPPSVSAPAPSISSDASESQNDVPSAFNVDGPATARRTRGGARRQAGRGRTSHTARVATICEYKLSHSS